MQYGICDGMCHGKSSAGMVPGKLLLPCPRSAGSNAVGPRLLIHQTDKLSAYFAASLHIWGLIHYPPLVDTGGSSSSSVPPRTASKIKTWL